ncbi:hypothetical protein [Microbacterium sp.]|uniref:hypothetical protein n=1 Tax=Microbacterium sp. TaxID=51671 RepID=UPI0028117968|nr:hypothetical protein [Microbacterium sp.]
MILAGFLLLSVGAVDLVRQFAPRRWIGYLAALIVLLVLGSVSAAVLPMLAAIAVGAAWTWAMPADRDPRFGFWPAVVLAVISALAVVWLGERTDAGIIGRSWTLDSPFGPISFDLALLVVGVVVFLLESGNLIVRAALSSEHSWRPDDVDDVRRAAPTGGTARDESARAGDASADPETVADGVQLAAPSRGGFKGGRLIGPLERVIVFMLTLTAAYPLLAATLAAKGIVRFPEISKDGETGARAEYFLVGSLVSWVIALGAAFLVWWGVHS